MFGLTINEMKKTFQMRVKKQLTLFSLVLLSLSDILGQTPAWFPGTPTVASTGALSVTLNYGINNRAGTVYIVIYNYNNTATYSSGQIKTRAGSAASGTVVYVATLPVTNTTKGTLLQIIANLPTPNQAYTIYVAGEGALNVFVAANSVRLDATTNSCSAIDMDFGYFQPEVCLNKGASVTLRYTIFSSNPDISGVYPGTKIYIDWGDNQYTTWFSSAITPPQPFIPTAFTHVYTYTGTSVCNYQIKSTVTSACNPLIVKQFPTNVIIHARDLSTEGDGNLLIAEEGTNITPIIQVCEGMSHTIRLRDMSTWNCQSPTYIDGSPAPSNSDPRNIQWLYGKDPTGAPKNTITGPGVVTISNLGVAPQNSARMLPSPYGPSSLSEWITIPASCKAGDYFMVYLKNWNKCNWPDAEYLSTYLTIQVVGKPPATVGVDRAICAGTSTTIGAPSVTGHMYSWTSVPAGFTSNAANPTVSPTVNTTYTLVETIAATTCTNTNSVTISVTPKSSIASISGTTPLCIGGTDTYSANSVVLGGGTGAWTSITPSIASVNSSTGLVTGVSDGTSFIRYTITGGCGGAVYKQKSVTVSPNASISSVTGTSPLCIGGTATYSANSAVLSGGTGAWSSSNTAIATVNSSTGFVTGVSVGTCNIIYTITGGCGGVTVTRQQAVTINPNASIASVTGTTPLCIGGTATYSANSAVLSGGTGAWSSSNTAIATVNSSTGEVTGVASGTCNIIYTITGGCGGVTLTRQQAVTISPNASIASVTGPTPLCIGGTDTFSANSLVLGGGTGAWSSSNTAVAAVNSLTGVVTGVAPGTCNIIYTITGGCGGVVFKQQTVTITPDASISSVTGVTPLCINETSIYTTSGVVLGGGTGAWSSSNIAVATVNSSTGEVTGVSAGTCNIIYTIIGGCNGTPSAQTSVTILPNNTITLTSGAGTDNQNKCINAPITAITYATTGASGANITGLPTGVTGGWSANFITISGTPTVSGIFNFTITLTGGCGTITTNGSITVGIPPDKASLTAVANPICVGTNAQLQIEITGGVPPFDVTLDNGVGTFSIPGFSYTKDLGTGLPVGLNSYNITSILDICNHSFVDLGSTAIIDVRPTPTPTISGNTTVCQDGTSPDITFTNPQALPVTITYNINGGTNTTVAVGAGTTATVSAPTTASGVFVYNLVSVVYQTSPTCINTLTGSATVTVRPTPTPTISGNTIVCQDGTSPDITFTNPQALPVTITYNINGGTNTTVAVGAGTTATVSAPTTASGVFVYNLVSVVYQTSPTCINTLTGSATVTVRPTPTPTISGNTIVCQDGTSPDITFTNPQALPVTITYNINGGTNTTVAVGAGTTATVSAPTTASGVFVYNLVSVVYQTSPTCINTLTGSATVTVRPTPTPTISGNTTVCQDGTSPDITFTNPQALPVTITYNINGGTNTTVAVGAGTTATVSAPTTASGVFVYNLVSVVYQTSPTCINTLTGSATVTVRPTPTPTISGNTTVCQDGTSPDITFTNPQALPVTITYNINGGTNTTVAVGAGTTATVSAPTTASGVFVYNLVSVVYQTSPTCINTLTGSATVTVRPTPTPTISGNTTVCQDGTSPDITFTNPQALPVTITYNINGGTNTTVVVGAGTTATVSAPTTASGVFVYNLVSVVYQTSPTCINTLTGSATVTVRPTPTPTISGNTTVCQDGTSPDITFTNPQALPVTITYNINGGTNTTVAVGAGTTATVSAPTTASGVFVYNLVSVVYQTSPTCINTLTGSATVTVRPTPIPTISGNTIVCQDGTSPDITFTNPQALPVTITYNINGGTNTTVAVGAGTTATVSAPTTASGVFVYNLVSVVYQTSPTCINTLTGSATVTVTKTVGIPVFSLGASSVRCQASGTVIYTASATNNTGITYSLDVTSISNGNSINPITGEVTYVDTWSGTSTITVSADGCNGPKTNDHTVTVVPLPDTPDINGEISVCGTGPTIYPYELGDGTYNIPGNEYHWIVPSGATKLAGGGINDSFIFLSFSTFGIKNLIVTENTTLSDKLYGYFKIVIHKGLSINRCHQFYTGSYYSMSGCPK